MKFQSPRVHALQRCSPMGGELLFKVVHQKRGLCAPREVHRHAFEEMESPRINHKGNIRVEKIAPTPHETQLQSNDQLHLMQKQKKLYSSNNHNILRAVSIWDSPARKMQEYSPQEHIQTRHISSIEWSQLIFNVSLQIHFTKATSKNAMSQHSFGSCLQKHFPKCKLHRLYKELGFAALYTPCLHQRLQKDVQQ